MRGLSPFSSAREGGAPRLLGAISWVVLAACTGTIQPEHLGERPSDPGPGRPGRSPEGPPEVHCGAPATPRVWLLSDRQYRRAVEDLLPGSTVQGVRTPGATADIFVHESELFRVDAALLSQYQTEARSLGRQVTERAPSVAGCGESRDCAEQFIASFGERAFARPLSEGEVERLLGLYDLGAEDGFGAGLGLVVEALLQAPDFLYRSEVGREGRLTAFETAEFLGFFLLDSVPDEGLLEAARSGALDTQEGVEGEVDRLLELPRVQEHLVSLVLTWLGAPRVLEVQKDPELFPDADEPLRQSMLDELRAFVRDVMFERRGTLGELLTSSRSFVDQRLAQLYGVEGDFGDRLEPVELDPAQRTGVLTSAAFLAAHSGTRTTDIVHRGLTIGRLLLCMPEVVSPPASLLASVEDAVEGLSERQLADYRAGSGACNACHQLIDPAGIALEHYDPVGAWRRDAGEEPVRSEATVVFDDTPHAVRGAPELAALLSESPQVHQCVADHFLRYAVGRRLGDDVACVREDALAALLSDDDPTRPFGPLVELFRTIATDPSLRRRAPLEVDE